MPFGARSTTPLARLRKASGLSQTRVAALANTSQPQINKLEHGQRKITKDWALRLASALGCHWLELMDAGPPLTAAEREIVDRYRGMSKDDQHTVKKIVDALAHKTGSNDDELAGPLQAQQ